jgi:hypothetical protein
MTTRKPAMSIADIRKVEEAIVSLYTVPTVTDRRLEGLDNAVLEIREAFGYRLVKCSLCKGDTPLILAHLHQGEHIGDFCCWDEKLRASE